MSPKRLRKRNEWPSEWPERSAGIREVLRVALPLMVSTGSFSLALFADRTFLLAFDGRAMGASMAAGNLFWTLVCLPVGIVSMTGAFVAQFIGAKEEENVGRLIWQSIWFAIAIIPLFALIAFWAPSLFRLAGQPAELVPLEASYLRVLLIGAAGVVIETALSGFFSGTERTRTIMWVSIASSLLNIGLDQLLIFGLGPLPAMGIEGAGIASTIAFWSKGVLFAWLIWRLRDRQRYQWAAGCHFDFPMLKRLLYFGFPAGLQFLTEAGGFSMIILQIGRLGDVPLRATTMAVNFNMVAFVPLVGVAIAASVLVGKHLTESGPRLASRAAMTALAIAVFYSSGWALLYVLAPDWLLRLYQVGGQHAGSNEAIEIARELLSFVALYVLFDAVQLILAGALRGAGDTWFVLFATAMISTLAVATGLLFEPPSGQLQWWWWMITLWIWLLGIVMSFRFLQGKWRNMTMIEDLPRQS